MTTTELRKTAWTVQDYDDAEYFTIDGHIYFSEDIARQIGRENGIVPERVPNRTSLKTVVVSR